MESHVLVPVASESTYQDQPLPPSLGYPLRGLGSLGARRAPHCNTPGVCHQLSNGFELKHDRSSGVEEAKVKCMKSSST